MFLAGLGSLGGGIADGLTTYEKMMGDRLRNQALSNDLEATDAYGAALAGKPSAMGADQPPSLLQRIGGILGFSPVPGNSPMETGAAGAPPTNATGAPLPPPMQSGQGGPFTSMPGEKGTSIFDDVRGLLPQGASGPFAAAPMPMQPGQPAQGPGGPFSGPQAQPASMPPLPRPGTMDLEQLVARVKAANPDASPAAIAGAVDRFRPFLTDQSKMLWQQLRMDLQQQGLDLRERNLQLQGQKAADQKGYRDERLKQFDTQEAGKNRRFDVGQQNINTRFQQNQERLRASLDQRTQLATQRLQQAQGISDRAAAMRAYEQAWREYRDSMAASIRADATMTGQQKADALAQLGRDMQQGLAKLDQFRQGAPLAQTPYGPLRAPNGGASFPDRENLQGVLERSAPVQSIRRDEQGGKNTNRAPSGTPAPAQAAPSPPASAPQTPPLSVFQGQPDGARIRFKNGQVWTLQNGQPVRVQ